MRVTLDEIAKLAGVSKATVSRVLNDVPDGVGSETRERVWEIIKKTNYSTDCSTLSARNMKSCTIATVVPDIANPFFADIAKAIESRAREKGYTTTISNTEFSEQNEANVIKNLVSKKVDGIILVTSIYRARAEHLLPEKYGIPMVLLDRKLMGKKNWYGVYSNNEMASFQCCEMLIKNGSDQIAYLSGPLDMSTSQERMNGYKLALRQYGCKQDPALIKYGDYTVESGYNAIVELERSGRRYNAVLAGNDLMALGAINAFREFSIKIPEDVELIGFDNIMFSRYFDPPLSTVQQPTVEMGRRATDMLLQMIDGEPVKENIVIDAKIVTRKSTKERGIL